MFGCRWLRLARVIRTTYWWPPRRPPLGRHRRQPQFTAIVVFEGQRVLYQPLAPGQTVFPALTKPTNISSADKLLESELVDIAPGERRGAGWSMNGFRDNRRFGGSSKGDVEREFCAATSPPFDGEVARFRNGLLDERLADKCVPLEPAGAVRELSQFRTEEICETLSLRIWALRGLTTCDIMSSACRCITRGGRHPLELTWLKGVRRRHFRCLLSSNPVQFVSAQCNSGEAWRCEEWKRSCVRGVRSTLPTIR